MASTSIVYMKYAFELVTLPGARAHEIPRQYFCRRLRVTLTRQGPVGAVRPWSAFRIGSRGFVEWYAGPTGATRNFTTPQAAAKSVVDSNWLQGTL